jgi:hypothetical protein
MDEREANIDVVFRNGLKDYEVLPPPEVWDKISPAVRKQQRAYIILRAAAMIAVLVTLGFLTSTWNNEVSNRLLNSPQASNPDVQPQAAIIPEEMLIADAGYVERPSSSEPVPVRSTVQPDLEGENNFSSQRNTSHLVADGLSQEVSGESRFRSREPVAVSLNIPVSEAIFQDIPPVDKKERWSIAALISPTYLSNFQTGNNEAVRQLGTIEQPVVSYAGGVALSYKVNRRFSVQSGLYYSSYGNELTGITSFGGFQNYDQAKGNRNFEVQTTNGLVYTDNSDVYLVDAASDTRMSAYIDNSTFDPTKASLEYLNSSLMQNLSYLELPVILRYKLVDRAIDFNLIGGLSSNLLVNNSVYTSLDGTKYEVGKTAGLNPVTFSSSLGMGMEYSFSKNFSLNFEPTFRYFLNPFSNTEGIGVHPYSFGIFSGISYKF